MTDINIMIMGKLDYVSISHFIFVYKKEVLDLLSILIWKCFGVDASI